MPLPLCRSGAGSYWIPIVDTVTRRSPSCSRLCVELAFRTCAYPCTVLGAKP